MALRKLVPSDVIKKMSTFANLALNTFVPISQFRNFFSFLFPFKIFSVDSHEKNDHKAQNLRSYLNVWVCFVTDWWFKRRSPFIEIAFLKKLLQITLFSVFVSFAFPDIYFRDNCQPFFTCYNPVLAQEDWSVSLFFVWHFLEFYNICSQPILSTIIGCSNKPYWVTPNFLLHTSIKFSETSTIEVISDLIYNIVELFCVCNLKRLIKVWKYDNSFIFWILFFCKGIFFYLISFRVDRNPQEIYFAQM